MRLQAWTDRGWFRSICWVGAQRNLLVVLDLSEWVPGVSLFIGFMLYFLGVAHLYLEGLGARSRGMEFVC